MPSFLKQDKENMRMRKILVNYIFNESRRQRKTRVQGICEFCEKQLKPADLYRKPITSQSRSRKEE